MRTKLNPRPLHELAAEAWSKRTTATDSLPSPAVESRIEKSEKVPGGTVRKFILATDGLETTILFLEPGDWNGRVVLGIAGAGKRAFLTSRKVGVARLLQEGVAVGLIDVPGTGESAYGDGRGRTSTNTAYSSTAQMLGTSLMRIRSTALLAAVEHVAAQTRKSGKTLRLGLWGESDTAPNPPSRRLDVPYDVDPFPTVSDPLGGQLVLYAAGSLKELDLRAVLGRGGLAGYESVFESPFLYVPHDALEPPFAFGADLPSVTALILKGASRHVRLERLVDARNRQGDPATLTRYPADRRLTLQSELSSDEEIVRWFLKCLE